MVYIAFFTELNLQICYYAQKRRIRRENCKYALDKIFMAIFSPNERLPSSATLPIPDIEIFLIQARFNWGKNDQIWRL